MGRDFADRANRDDSTAPTPRPSRGGRRRDARTNPSDGPSPDGSSGNDATARHGVRPRRPNRGRLGPDARTNPTPSPSPFGSRLYAPCTRPRPADPRGPHPSPERTQGPPQALNPPEVRPRRPAASRAPAARHGPSPGGRIRFFGRNSLESAPQSHIMPWNRPHRLEDPGAARAENSLPAQPHPRSGPPDPGGSPLVPARRLPVVYVGDGSPQRPRRTPEPRGRRRRSDFVSWAGSRRNAAERDDLSGAEAASPPDGGRDAPRDPGASTSGPPRPRRRHLPATQRHPQNTKESVS
jgi:hypothetical protein